MNSTLVPIVVTGSGVISPFGVGVDRLWRELALGTLPFVPAPPSDRGVPVPRLAATVDRFAEEIEASIDARRLRRVSALSQRTVAVAGLALDDAGIAAEDQALRDEISVVLGTAFGSSRYHFDYYERLFRGGLRDASPLLFSECVMNAAAGHASLAHRLRGASLALVGGEDVGLVAIADAADRIASGETRAALAGGADEYCEMVHAALATRGLVGDEAARPYAEGAPPSVYGEGAALMFLERMTDARSRGSEPGVALLGWSAARSQAGGSSAVARALRDALARAELDSSDVDLVVSGADGRDLEALERDALGEIFGSRKTPVALVCPKRALGEAFAFTSSALAVLAAESVRRGESPAQVLGYSPDRSPRGCGLGVGARPVRHSIALATNRAGAATVLVLGARSR